jgi:hypothetical protein
VLGPTHPNTLTTARSLHGVRADIRANALSFEARIGRYAVEDGKELSLKAECVARAGCAGASEEARSVCGGGLFVVVMSVMVAFSIAVIFSE